MKPATVVCPFCNSQEFECGEKEKYLLCYCKSCGMKWMESRAVEAKT